MFYPQFRFFIALFFFVMAYFSQAQVAPLHTQKIGQLPYNQLLNDIWGWHDGAGRELALVGAINGFSVVDVTQPSQAVEKFYVPGARSIWRDIKTYGKYAYVVHDVVDVNSPLPADGVVIVDLSTTDSLQPRVWNFRPQLFFAGDTTVLLRAHNIYIDEFARLFVFGSNIGKGGALIFDLAANPEQPEFIGIEDRYYYHDGYARGDTLWVAAVFNGLIAAIDVGLPFAPRWLGQVNTPGGTAHNVWPSDDHKYVFSTDEITNGLVAAFDVSDLQNMRYVSKTRSSFDNTSIPHNVHVWGNYLVTSHYRSGLHIADATYPDNLVEIGHFDTNPLAGNGFNGAWGAYPYLPSKNILVTDIENGLFLVRFEEKQASWLYATVRDSLTNNTLPNAAIKWEGLALEEYSSIAGAYKFGYHQALTDTVVVWVAGYQTRRIPINLLPGVRYDKTFALLPEGYVPPKTFAPFDRIPIQNNPLVGGILRLNFDGFRVNQNVFVRLRNVLGAVVFAEGRTGPFDNSLQFATQLPAGTYLLEVQFDNAPLASEKVVVVYP